MRVYSIKTYKDVREIKMVRRKALDEEKHSSPTPTIVVYASFCYINTLWMHPWCNCGCPILGEPLCCGLSLQR